MWLELNLQSFDNLQGIYDQSTKKEQMEISYYVRPTKRKGEFDTDDDEDRYEPPARPVSIKKGKKPQTNKISIDWILFRRSGDQILSNM